MESELRDNIVELKVKLTRKKNKLSSLTEGRAKEKEVEDVRWRDLEEKF